MTFDEAAVRILVSGSSEKVKQEQLAALAKQAAAAIRGECPECGSSEVVDNGARRQIDLSFCCQGCGHQWDMVPL